jgi:hypothetical protein
MKVYVYMTTWPFEPSTSEDLIRVFTSIDDFPQPELPEGKDGKWQWHSDVDAWCWYSNHRPGFDQSQRWGRTQHTVFERELDANAPS